MNPLCCVVNLDYKCDKCNRTYCARCLNELSQGPWAPNNPKCICGCANKWTDLKYPKIKKEVI